MTSNDLRQLPDPTTLPPLLRALWHDAQGDWQAAHAVAQDIPTPDGARLHAYLHRKEGDDFNARYWYRQAGVAPFAGTLPDEWQALATDFLRA